MAILSVVRFFAVSRFLRANAWDNHDPRAPGAERRAMRFPGPATGPGRHARGGYPGSAQKVVLLLRSDIGVGEHLEGMTGRNQSDRVVVLPERSALGCGCLLDGRLGPLVPHSGAGHDRAAIGVADQDNRPGDGPQQGRQVGGVRPLDRAAGWRTRWRYSRGRPRRESPRRSRWRQPRRHGRTRSSGWR